MADINLKNLARMTVSSSGTGTITLNAAVTGFLTFDLAGCSTAAAGSVVRYAISDTTQSEIAYGTYTSSSVTLTRGSSTTGMKSTNSNSPINMSNSAQVFITDSDADHPIRPDTNLTSGALSLNMTFSGTANFTSTVTIGTLVLTTVGAHTITGAITYGGVTLSNAVTGTGNMVLSASPTFTGTTTIATLALTTVGAHTISGAITYGGVTLTNAVTGTGSMVLSASPTFTGTVGAAAITATGAVSAGSVAGTMVATQANQETATSTTTVVSPGRQQYHPSAAKAYVSFLGASGAIGVSYNVTSVTRVGTGVYNINFTNAFSSASYVACATIDGTSVLIVQMDSSNSTASLLRINVYTTAGVATDPPAVQVICFGDQ